MTQNRQDAPRTREWDLTFALLTEGYPCLSRRAEALGSDVFRTRVALERTVCLRGREAAEVFYDARRFTRHGAIPAPMLSVLQGRGVAATLKGEAHRRRKAFIMEGMGPERVAAFREGFERRWREAEAEWARAGEVVLLDAARDVLGETVIDWCGLHRLEAADRRTLVSASAACIEGVLPARLPAHLAARRARAIMDAILDREIEATRREPERAPEDSPLRRIALHEEDGRPLPREVASSELENLVRPAVAIGRFIAYGALMLTKHPQAREALVGAEPDAARRAALEARRLCPFFTLIPARARERFEWGGARFEPGMRTLLDVYGTNRHPALYEEPDAFRPDRWRGREPDPFGLIPQGGGEFGGHRCAGEWITQACVETAMARLAGDLEWETEPGAFDVPRSRLPTRPRDGFRIRNIRLRERAAA